jgi:hypothetical protein
LPTDGRPFDIGLDVPAGTYSVDAQLVVFSTSIACFRDNCHGGAFGSYTGRLVPVEVGCTLRTPGQERRFGTWAEGVDTIAQPMALTLDRPARIALSCRLTPQERIVAGEFDHAAVDQMTIVATRLPRTTVSRRIVLNATLAALPRTPERSTAALADRIVADAFRPPIRPIPGRP